MKPVKPISVIILGLALLYPLQRWIDRTTPREVIGDETLYLSGAAVKKMSLGLESLAADIYWIRTVQYFGRKLLDNNRPASSGASSDIRMDLLAPLLDTIVTLDPHYLSAYRFGAIFLPERDLPAAIALLEKGIRENPERWRLYQDLAYIYWQAGNGAEGDARLNYYAKAAEWYERGSEVPGALWWMRDLAGYMRLEGGSREAARAIYSGYLTSDDQNVRAQAVLRLEQLRSLEEREAIDSALARYQKETGECPQDLRALASKLRAMKLTLNEAQVPVDPEGFPYTLDQSNCRSKLALESPIPR
jgi:tetratricopeptide (TPR) repeat protein